MARKFLVPIDLSKQELQNAVVQNLASAPSSPVAGQIYFNTTSDTLFFYDGTAWVDTQTAPYSYGTLGEITTIDVGDTASAGTSANLARADHQHAAPSFGNVSASTTYGISAANGTSTSLARADHTHGTPVHDNAAHNSINLNALAAPTADVSLNSHKITNLATPTNATDAANKGYVDNAVAGLSWKEAVHLLAASNVALTGSTGTLVIDGHAALDDTDSGYRILLKGQTTASENGIYVYSDNGTSYTLARATDGDAYEELIGAAVFVSEGTSYGATSWVQTNHYLTAFTGQSWSQFSGQGTYTASNGVALSGNNFSFAPKTDGGLATGSTGGYVKLQTNSGLGTTGDGLAVGAGTGISVTTGTVAIDTSVVARKYATSIGNGSATTFTVTHNLNNLDVIVQVYTNSDGSEVFADVARATNNTVTVSVADVPTSNQYRVVVIG